MPTRLGILILALVLSVTSLGFSDKTQAADGVAPLAGPEIRPLLLERMQTGQSRRSQSRGAVGSATPAELETSARGRFAAGLLLGAAHARWR